MEVWDETAAREFQSALRSGAAALGIALTPEQVGAMTRYADGLLHANARVNLTRITEPADVAVKHFLDSLTVLRAAADLAPSALVADVGTGAGFPGIPLAIVRPDLHLTLLDALRKRLDVLAELVADLGLDNVVLVHARAEDAGRDPAHRDRYDLVTARAVAALPTLLEWCGPLVRPGGRLVAMKGGGVDDELAASASAARQLNLHLDGDLAVALPPTGDDPAPAQRRLLVWEKKGPTPARLPRRAAEIKARPL